MDSLVYGVLESLENSEHSVADFIAALKSEVESKARECRDDEARWLRWRRDDVCDYSADEREWWYAQERLLQAQQFKEAA